MTRVCINPSTLAEPAGHFDWAIRIGNILHISGMSALSHIPGDLHDRYVPPSIEHQTRLTYENIKRVMDAAGGTMPDIFKLVVYYVRATDWNVVDRITREYLPNRGFIRTGFVTELLHPDMLIEVEAAALLY
jgi:enamine deaminase RidA (YjgF/YER057c/UK114 family)